MLISFRNILIAASLAATTFMSSFASATLVTYTDRTLFQNALDSFQVDDVNSVPTYSFSGVLNRPDYTISTGGMWGCVNHSGCGVNTPSGFDSTYIWNYQGLDTFTFSSAVNGFGFDFANPSCCDYGSVPVINGVTASATAGFFGVISSVALTSFTVDQTNDYMLMDNITFGSGTGNSTSVPEPSALLLLGLGLLGLTFARKNK